MFRFQCKEEFDQWQQVMQSLSHLGIQINENMENISPFIVLHVRNSTTRSAGHFGSGRAVNKDGFSPRFQTVHQQWAEIPLYIQEVNFFSCIYLLEKTVSHTQHTQPWIHLSLHLKNHAHQKRIWKKPQSIIRDWKWQQSTLNWYHRIPLHPLAFILLWLNWATLSKNP